MLTDTRHLLSIPVSPVVSKIFAPFNKGHKGKVSRHMELPAAIHMVRGVFLGASPRLAPKSPLVQKEFIKRLLAFAAPRP